jgi:sec-independent protein translocase protein TatA
MRNIGAPEIILVLVVLVLLFGAKKLPDLSRSLGRSMRIFKSEVKQMKEDDEPARPPRPIEGTITPEARPAAEPRQVVPDPERREP